jgi:hypothetical protein
MRSPCLIFRIKVYKCSGFYWLCTYSPLHTQFHFFKWFYFMVVLLSFTSWFYMMVLFADFIWWFYFVVLFNVFISRFYFSVFQYGLDHSTWWFTWQFYMMVYLTVSYDGLLDSFIWWFFNMVFYYGLILCFCTMVLHYSLA